MEDYIQKVRKVIGHDPILLPHAVVIVFDEDNKILVETRADDHYLDFPGGNVEIAEEVETTAKRELFEETGLIADELELFKIYSGEITKYTYFNKDVIYGVDIVYLCHQYHGELKMDPKEVSELRFLDVNDINGPLSPRNKQIIMDLKNRL